MITGICVWSIVMSLESQSNTRISTSKSLSDLSLLIKSNPILAITFAIALFSLAGVPPLAGFYAKMQIFLASVESCMFFIATIGILSSVISTFYYIRIVKIMYFESSTSGKLYHPIKSNISILIVCLFYFLLFLFINPTFIYLISHKIVLFLTTKMI